MCYDYDKTFKMFRAKLLEMSFAEQLALLNHYHNLKLYHTLQIDYIDKVGDEVEDLDEHGHALYCDSRIHDIISVMAEQRKLLKPSLCISLTTEK